MTNTLYQWCLDNLYATELVYISVWAAHVGVREGFSVVQDPFFLLTRFVDKKILKQFVHVCGGRRGVLLQYTFGAFLCQLVVGPGHGRVLGAQREIASVCMPQLCSMCHADYACGARKLCIWSVHDLDGLFATEGVCCGGWIGLRVVVVQTRRRLIRQIRQIRPHRRS
jgi:hypothetical protein